MTEKLTVENINDTLHELDKLVQCWDDRLTIKDLSIAERYTEGKLRLVVEFSTFDGAGKKHRAVLERIAGIRRPKVDRGDKLRDVIPELPLERHLDHGVRCAYRYDRLVFVDSVKLVDHPKGFAPTAVRFEAVDESDGRFGDPLYFSVGVGFKFLSISPNWEASSTAGLLFVDQDKLPRELVKSSAQVMDNVADDAAQRLGNALDDADRIHARAGIRLFLNDELIGTSVMEGFDLGVQIHDVAFGPFNLYPYAGQSGSR